MKNMDEEAEAVGVGPWNMTTEHGYRCDECISALQKAVRRCDADGAVWWAHELNISGFGGWVWKRLLIIVSEDVGLAEPNAPAVVNGLYQISQVLLAHQKKPGPGEKVQHPWLELLQATWFLARCPKSREVADLCGVLDFRFRRNDLRPVPDEALDMHTARGRAMGRGSVHFEDQSVDGGRCCANEIEIDGNRYRKEFYALWKVPADPSSRVYEAIDLVPVDPPTRDLG